MDVGVFSHVSPVICIFFVTDCVDTFAAFKREYVQSYLCDAE